MKPFYLLILALVISTASCRTKDGEPGPAGESTLNQQGSITGTITYNNNNNGGAGTTTFNYQYYESIEDNKFYFNGNSSETYYELQFGRRDLKDANNYFDISCYGYGMDETEDDPNINYFDFSFLSVIDNKLYKFERYEVFNITNVKLDESTGRLTFDFSGDAYSTIGSATLTGKVDVILNRTRSTMID